MFADFTSNFIPGGLHTFDRWTAGQIAFAQAVGIALATCLLGLWQV